MEEKQNDDAVSGEPSKLDVSSLVRQTLEEFMRAERARSEPAYKAELQDERRRREQLERRLTEVEEENRRSRQMAEEADRSSTIRSELQRLGVSKVDLAFRAIRDDITRAEDGRLVAKGAQGEVNLKEFLSGFVSENPEFLPARISGGSGVSAAQKTSPGASSGSIDLEKIRPGMSKEEMDRARQEIARVASQTLKGL